MKQKIIVTGGCGYIGSHTVVELITHNFEVVILDDLSNSNIKTLDRIAKITGIRPIFEQLDLKNSEQTKAVFQKHKDTAAVVHFAAYKAVAESVQNPVMYYKNNFFSLLNTLEAQLEQGINNFIFSSSATVYGEPKKLPITEENQVQRPFSPYGNTKKIAEEILEDMVKAHQDFSTISLRYFNPIGAHLSGNLGELPNGIPNNLMPYITQTAAGIRKELQVFGNDYDTKDGTAIRDYIHVVDLADAHVKTVKRLLNKKQEKSLEIFNLGTGNGYTVLEVIQSFEKITKKPLNYKIVSRRAGDVPALYASTELAKEKLNWETQLNIDDMVASSWKWEENLKNEKN
ncbi:UDP-glucose 4-epimerase GalE [Kordia sp.]|uniref:UDP-glucose 4-epimerase GalE n=1 Tax=Kordia sp. TaxID=1965332 RepID=UPI003B5CC683